MRPGRGLAPANSAHRGVCANRANRSTLGDSAFWLNAPEYGAGQFHCLRATCTFKIAQVGPTQVLSTPSSRAFSSRIPA